MKFVPDYHNVVDAAQNKPAKRLPLYEHGIAPSIMEAVLGVKFAHLYETDKDTYFKHYCNFFLQMGYDTVSFESSIGLAMPNSGALGGHKKGAIHTAEDFQQYPWDQIEDRFFQMHTEDLKALRKNLPEGMRAIGGAGNGIFECVQDIVGYMDLCYIREDEPELYAALFKKVGETNLRIWNRLLEEFGDIFCVCRFGDDLGFKSTTLLPPEDIRAYIIPAYRPIIEAVHQAGKPFLLHSCGCIFDVMEDIIAAGIDAKHSNEDQIAPFQQWVDLYGSRIGNFGGIDTDAVCRLPKEEMTQYIENVITSASNHGGFAFGSGNSIPDYVPVDQYVHMVNTVRRLRGEDIPSR